MRAFSERAVFAAIVLKNGEDKFGFSIISGRHPAIGIFSPLCQRKLQSLFPHLLYLAFFSLESRAGQIAKGQEDQKDVSVPTGPGPAFMVIQTQFIFQFLVSLLDPKSFVEETDHLQGRHFLRQITEEISQFKLAISLVTSLDDQPNLFVNKAFSISLGWPNSPGDCFNYQGLASTIPAQFEMLPIIFSDTCSKLRNFDGWRIRLDHSRILLGPSSPPFSRLSLQKHWWVQKNLSVRIDANHISLSPFSQFLPKLGHVPIPGIRNNCAMRNTFLQSKINLLQRYLPFLTVMHSLGHPSLLPHQNVFGILHIVPGLWNIQVHCVRPTHFLSHVAQAYTHLTICNLPKSSTILPRHTDTVPALLGKTRVVNNQDPLRIARLSQHPPPIYSGYSSVVPFHLCQQTLHPPFRGVDPVRHRLNRLTFPFHHQPRNIAFGKLFAFSSTEKRGIRRQVFLNAGKCDIVCHAKYIAHIFLKSNLNLSE